jgi:UDP-N-acetylmuramoylalanine--D-glutamate ligase
LELSSFQLENTYSKCINIGIITNLLNNHFDSVFSKEVYFASKLKLVKLSKLCYIPKCLLKNSKRKNVKIIDNLYQNINENLNKYNQIYWNIASDIALSLNIPKINISNNKNSFKMEPYRMEKVKEKDKLIFINDSKSTSISSTNACLDVYNDKKRIIILGGISKKENFEKINKKKDDIILCYGKDRLKIFNEIGDLYFLKLDEIIEYIKIHYKNIDRYVIFSPGCASLDQFTSYMERGHKFNQLIENIF